MSAFLLSVVSVISFLPLVIAQFNRGQSFRVENVVGFIVEVINYMIAIAAPIFIVILGEYNTSEFLFSKILLFILLFIVLRNVMSKTPFGEDNEKVGLMVSLIISILSVRFINQNAFFETIFIQYGVLGIAITTIIPMVIFFYFINNTKVGTFGRKMFWGIYAITLGAIWITRFNELPEVANYIYMFTFAAAILFILFDKSIKKYFGLYQFKDFETRTNERSIIELKRDLRQYKQDLTDGVINHSQYEQLKKEIFKSIKSLMKS